MADEAKQFSDQELVERLIENDQDVWKMVIVTMVVPLTKTRKIAEILTKINESSMTVVSELYLDLQKEECRKLKNFRFEGPFRGWLFFQVKNAIKIIIRKSKRAEALDLSDYDVDEALSVWITHDRPSGLQDEVDIGEACFARLWKSNPKFAFVLLLKNKLELPSDEVCMLLGLSSANNVDQINRRAKQQMIQFKKEDFK